MNKKNPRIKRGICIICGCSNEDACMNEDHGPCFWFDNHETLCSHCVLYPGKTQRQMPYTDKPAVLFPETLEYLLEYTDGIRTAEVYENSPVEWLVKGTKAAADIFEAKIKELFPAARKIAHRAYLIDPRDFVIKQVAKQ